MEQVQKPYLVEFDVFRNGRRDVRLKVLLIDPAGVRHSYDGVGVVLELRFGEYGIHLRGGVFFVGHVLAGHEIGLAGEGIEQLTPFNIILSQFNRRIDIDS